MSQQLSADALPSFMNITGTDTATATQYLELTNWNLEESVNLYMESGAEDGHATTMQQDTANSPHSGSNINDDVRAPDPSKRQRLVGADLNFEAPQRRSQNRFRDFAAESVAAAISSDGMISSAFQGEASSQSSQNLNALFKPPSELTFDGSYAEARQAAKSAAKWLLVNIQDEIVFASHMLNRDTWSDDVVQNLVASGFIFWQSFWASESGKKVCALYQIDRDCLPFIGIIHPRTGEILAQWNGFVEPTILVEKISDFCCQNILENTVEKETINLVEEESRESLDENEDPNLAAAIAASLEEKSKSMHDVDEEMKDDQSIDMLPTEPSATDPNVTRIQIRCPDGTRMIRRFYKSDPISILRTFVKENVQEARARPFALRRAYPPAAIDCNGSEALSDRNLENAVLHVDWI